MPQNDHYPRRTDMDVAMGLDDVAPNTPFVTYIPSGDIHEGKLVQRGIFRSGPEYDENDTRWWAEADIEGAQTTRRVLLYDAGISPDESGQNWSTAVTIFDDSDR